MEDALPSFKNNGAIDPLASMDDLRAKIFEWYDGYNWGGKTRVLNPYSILKLFRNCSFTNYWIQSGRPIHLTTLIKERPLDFIQPQLESYSGEEVRKSDLNQLQPVPVLFHSGYLTLDTESESVVADFESKQKKSDDNYSFRLPNKEVSSSYNLECFDTIFSLKKEQVTTKSEKLKQAFLNRNSETISSILSGFFSAIPYHYRPKDESAFHGYIHLILSALGFKPVNELPGSQGRLDLCFELPEEKFFIIELKYCPELKLLTKEQQNKILADVAKELITPAIIDKSLAMALRNKLNNNKELINLILSKSPIHDNTGMNDNQILAQEAKKILSESEITVVLSDTVRNNLNPEHLRKILPNAISDSFILKERIENILSAATTQALKDIMNREYHGIIKLKAKEIIDIGIALYGNGEIVKTVFGPVHKLNH
jgi:hypothetical protein